MRNLIPSFSFYSPTHLHLMNSGKWFMLILAGFFSLTSCKHDEGIGGTGTIRGKILVQEFNSSGVYQGSHYGMEEKVYLIFGSDATYGNDVKTNYDGTYEFTYLYPGKYTILAYSNCDTCVSGSTAVLTEVEIKKNKELLEVPDIIVKR